MGISAPAGLLGNTRETVELTPEGTYNVELAKEPTSTTKDDGATVIQYDFVITGPTNANKHVFKSFWFREVDETDEKAVASAKRTRIDHNKMLKVLLLPEEHDLVQNGQGDSLVLAGRACNLTVSHYKYDEKIDGVPTGQKKEGENDRFSKYEEVV